MRKDKPGRCGTFEWCGVESIRHWQFWGRLSIRGRDGRGHPLTLLAAKLKEQVGWALPAGPRDLPLLESKLDEHCVLPEPPALVPLPRLRKIQIKTTTVVSIL